MTTEETKTIDIKGIDKVELLKAMWNESKPAKFYLYNPDQEVPEFDEEEAKKAVKKRIDYFSGRCIKTDISGDTVDPYLYNRDFGEGKLEEIVKSLKMKMKI